MYWKPKHQHACLQWLSADTRQQYRIYNILHPALVEMAHVILKRYFSISFAKEKIYEAEAINEVFIRLENYDCTKGKAYTFCGMIIKQWYYDKEVTQYNTHFITLDFIDDYQPIEDYQSMYDKHEEIDCLAVLKRLSEIRLKLLTEMKEAKEYWYVRNRKPKVEKLISIVDCCEEYVIRFENFDFSGVIDYCRNKLNIPSGSFSIYLNDLFGVYGIINDYEYKKEKNKHYSIVQDDFTPDTVKITEWQRKHRGREKKHYDYLYF